MSCLIVAPNPDLCCSSLGITLNYGSEKSGGRVLDTMLGRESVLEHPTCSAVIASVYSSSAPSSLSSGTTEGPPASETWSASDADDGCEYGGGEYCDDDEGESDEEASGVEDPIPSSPKAIEYLTRLVKKSPHCTQALNEFKLSSRSFCQAGYAKYDLNDPETSNFDAGYIRTIILLYVKVLLCIIM